ncbi:MAG: PAS domain-containing sensor histidine kinase [Deltaproteobacteria bacterium]|nr:MAG: PAS domain-containing sensor histidine kinase [Deltaproteobacteria bacterium]
MPYDRQREVYSAVFRHAPEAICIAEPDGQLMELNVAACALLRVESEHLAGRPLSCLFAPADHACLCAGLEARRQASCGEPLQLHLSRDGSAVHVNATLQCTAHSGRGFWMLRLWETANIDAHDEVTALRVGVAKEFSNENIYIECMQTFANQIVEKLWGGCVVQLNDDLGVKLGTAVAGRSASRRFLLEQLPQSFTLAEASAIHCVSSASPGGALQASHTQRGKQGHTPCPAVATQLSSRDFIVAPLRARSHNLGYMLFADPQLAATGVQEGLPIASELGRALALMLEDRQRLVSCQQQLSTYETFSEVVAHDLSTVLNTVRLTAENISAGGVGKNDDALGVIIRSAEQMGSLLQDLRDVRSLVEGSLSVCLSKSDMVPIVQQTFGAFVAEARAYGLELGLDMAPGTLPFYGDSLRIAQVLRNLLHNALKYTDEGGKVTMAVRREGERIVTEVHDTGRGLSAAEVDLAFGRYWRGRATAKGRGQGLGLGLYICQTIVQAHCGELGVRSVPGRGSSFWISLPCEKAVNSGAALPGLRPRGPPASAR